MVQSAKITNHHFNLPHQEIRSRIDRLIQASQLANGNIKIVLNYRTAQTSDALDFYAFFIPHHYPSVQNYLDGVDTISFSAERTNPNAKVANFELTARVQQEIDKHNAYEALLLDQSGCITEGSRSNIFMVQGNDLFTAPQKNVLPGITRGFVLEVCKKLDYVIMEKNINIDVLAEMEAIFLTGTSPNVLPIKKVDQHYFKSASNPVVRNITQAYDDLVNNYLKNYHH